MGTDAQIVAHDYALLVAGGLEATVASALFQEVGLRSSPLERKPLQPGFAAGAAGGVGVLLATMAEPLPAAVLVSPCLAAALAVIV